jgi:hypothetical protein
MMQESKMQVGCLAGYTCISASLESKPCHYLSSGFRSAPSAFQPAVFVAEHDEGHCLLALGQQRTSQQQRRHHCLEARRVVTLPPRFNDLLSRA